MQAKIIAVFNEKGGSGKTTTTCQLAGSFGLRGYDVLVADLDSQGTASTWLSNEEGQNIKAKIWEGHRFKSGVKDQLRELSAKFEIIVVDCPPSVEQPSTWNALLVADLILIPTKLSPPDITALAAAKKLARKAIEEARRNIPVRVVANTARMHMNDDKEFFSQLQADSEFPPLELVLGDRKAFSRSMIVGSTVHYFQSENAKKMEPAVAETEALCNAVEDLLKLRGKGGKR
jgi:chromosome partitioning protein